MGCPLFAELGRARVGRACQCGRSSSSARRRMPRRRTRSRSAPRAVCRAARRRVRKRRLTRDTLEERGFTPRDALQDQRVGALRQQLRLRIRVLRPAQQFSIVCLSSRNVAFFTLSLSMPVRGYSIYPLPRDGPLCAHPESPRDASREGATGERARASRSLSTGARSFAMAPTTEAITSVSPATACAATFATEPRSRPLRSRGHVRSARGARGRRVRCRRARPAIARVRSVRKEGRDVPN